MTSRDFCYWLQGYLELELTVGEMSATQVECVRRHLQLVFRHEIDPSFGGKKEQEVLDKIHAGPPAGELIRC